MSADLTLCGYRIVCDVREVSDTKVWMGKASVVKPPDAGGIQRIHKILATTCFISEKAAVDHLVAGAKNWIDREMENTRLRSRRERQT